MTYDGNNTKSRSEIREQVVNGLPTTAQQRIEAHNRHEEEERTAEILRDIADVLSKPTTTSTPSPATVAKVVVIAGLYGLALIGASEIGKRLRG